MQLIGQKQYGTDDEDPHPDPGIPAEKLMLYFSILRPGTAHSATHHLASLAGTSHQLPVLRTERRFLRELGRMDREGLIQLGKTEITLL